MAINLTRMKGAGSLCHEMFHGLANYLASLYRPGTSDLAEEMPALPYSIMVADQEGGLRREVYERFLELQGAIMGIESEQAGIPA